MKLRHLTLLFFIALLAVTCKQMGEITPTSIRQLKPSEVSSFHQPVMLQVGWFPYEQHSFEKTGKGEWRIVKNKDTDRSGMVPHVLISYPGTTDSLWVSMNTDNELLGKLIKHTLMTQEPIARPYSDFFEEAKCSKCHPPEIDKGFE